MKELLKNSLREQKIDYSEEQISQFVIFYDELISTNKNINLTRITSENDFIQKHVLDSLASRRYLKNQIKVVDIGSGAGFPSIPLKIMLPNISFVLVDSVNKKVEFLNKTIKELSLKNIKAVHSRIEDFAREKEYRENFDICISRAVANLRTLLEYSAPLVKVGGKIIAYKSANYISELEEAKNAIKEFNLSLWKTHKYSINDRENYLLIFNKNKRIGEKYPRRNNKPRNFPI